MCYIVWNHLDFYDVLSLRNTCKRFNELKIREIVNIDEYLSLKMDREVLRKYPDIVALKLFKPINLDFMNNLKKLDFMNNLKKLEISGAMIEPQMFSDLNLEELWMFDCDGRADLSHMGNLKRLKICQLLSYEKKKSHVESFNQHDIRGLNLEYLSISGNKMITDLSHMTNLKILDIGESNVDDHGIRDLNLEILYVDNNQNIVNLSLIRGLKCLYANNCFNLRQQGIESLNLRELYIDKNEQIIDVSFMTNLKILSVNDCNQINDQSIRGLDLEELYCDNVRNITDLSYMPNLKVLSIRGHGGPTDHGISRLNLFELYLDFNETITKISHMSNLKILSIECDPTPSLLCDLSDQSVMCSRIGDSELKTLHLEELNANENTKVIDLNHMSDLKILYIEGQSGVDQHGIQKLNLTELYMNDNDKIKDLNHMNKLRILDIGGKCAVNYDGFKELRNLKKLYHCGNRNFPNGYFWLPRIN